MNYWSSLALRISLAFLVRPEFIYNSLVMVTMFFPYLMLKVFGYDVMLLMDERSLLVNGIELEFVSACVASSAYYLLALLILTTKDLGIRKSIKMFFYGSVSIFLMNSLRVVLLILLVINNQVSWFKIVHLTFWYVVSTLYVVLIWIMLTKIYKVKNVPVYSDLAYLIRILRHQK